MDEQFYQWIELFLIVLVFLFQFLQEIFDFVLLILFQLFEPGS